MRRWSAAGPVALGPLLLLLLLAMTSRTVQARTGAPPKVASFLPFAGPPEAVRVTTWRSYNSRVTNRVKA